MQVWYDPADAEVDVVFVHGVAGDRETTWTHPSATEPWLQSFLPEYLPTAQILSFGYNAYSAPPGWDGTSLLQHHATCLLQALTEHRRITKASKRPLIFVGHSSGGIVCKSALLQSRTSKDPRYQDVRKCTEAVAFLGTPQRGSDLSEWSKIPIRVLNVPYENSCSLLSVLQTSLTSLNEIQDGFISLIEELQQQGHYMKIICFWEALPVLEDVFVVPKAAACLENEHAFPIEASHIDMARFQSTRDQGFIRVVGELKHWVSELDYLVLPESMATRKAKQLEQQRKGCLQSLAFEEMSSRKAAIESPCSNTCDWIAESSIYRSWCDMTSSDRYPILWIKGKPGSGKSILMKKVIESFRSSASFHDCLSLDYFFNARGTKLEKTPAGLYRTLLWSLLESSTSAMDDCLPHYVRKEKASLTGNVTWTTEEVSERLKSALLSANSKIYVFIDAVDECDDDQVKEMIDFFEHCVIEAVTNHRCIGFCFSSRHYPQINLRRALGREIFMENNNEQDIRSYVEQNLPSPEGKLLDDFIDSVVQKSAGIFIWAVFVVQRLLKMFHNGDMPNDVYKILSSIPPSLQGLFEMTFTDMDADQKSNIARIAAWIICAQRPLKPQELFFALRVGAEPSLMSFRDIAIADYDRRQFGQYLLEVSGGLFEVVISSRLARTERVQVIHESVREFFLGSDTVVHILGIPGEQTFAHYAHECILSTCSRLLEAVEIRQALPAGAADGFIETAELASMFCRPREAPIEALRNLDVYYIHDHVFDHLKELYRLDNGDESHQAQFKPETGRKIFEGWLLVFYCMVIQNGSARKMQQTFISMLIQDASLVGLSALDVRVIASAINGLIIFINKAMKDGLDIKRALVRPEQLTFHDGNSPADTAHYWYKEAVSLRSRMHLTAGGYSSTSSTSLWNRQKCPPRMLLSLRLFFKSKGSILGHEELLPLFSTKAIGQAIGRAIDPEQAEVDQDDVFKSLFPCIELGYYVVLPDTSATKEVQENWRLLEYPITTVPVIDWGIFRRISRSEELLSYWDEPLVWTSGIRSDALRSLLDAKKREWESSMLTLIINPGDIESLTKEQNHENGPYVDLNRLLACWLSDVPNRKRSPRPRCTLFARRKDLDLIHYPLLAP